MTNYDERIAKIRKSIERCSNPATIHRKEKQIRQYEIWKKMLDNKEQA